MGTRPVDSTDAAGFLSALDSDCDGLTNRGNASHDGASNSTSTAGNFSSSPYYLMPWLQRSAWIAVFALLVIVAAVGNSLVAWIVFGQFAFLSRTFWLGLSMAFK